jgi:hypothetical protein
MVCQADLRSPPCECTRAATLFTSPFFSPFADELRFLEHAKQAKLERLKQFTETLSALAGKLKGELRAPAESDIGSVRYDLKEVAKATLLPRCNLQSHAQLHFHLPHSH